MIQGSGIQFSFDIQKQLDHMLYPGLLILLNDELQFSQVMGIAEGVLTLLEGKVIEKSIKVRTMRNEKVHFFIPKSK